MKEQAYIVKVSYRKGPTEIYGGVDNHYESKEVAEEIANELVTYEHRVMESWVEEVESIERKLDRHGLLRTHLTLST